MPTKMPRVRYRPSSATDVLRRQIIFPVIAGAGTWFALDRLSVEIESGNANTMVCAILGMNATLLGFLVSAGALIYAVAHTALLKNIHRTGHLNRILRALFLDASIFLCALCLSLVLLVVDFDLRLIYGLLSINGAAIAGLMQVGFSLYQLLSSIGPSDKKLEFD